MKNIPTATRLRVSAMSVHPMPLNKIWSIAIHLVSRRPVARTRRLSLNSVEDRGVNAGPFDLGNCADSGAPFLIHFPSLVWLFILGKRVAGAPRRTFPVAQPRVGGP